MKIKDQVPNFITLLNLISGAIAIVMVFSGELRCASWFIVLAAVFDFLDGFAARLLHAKSAIGAQLDSLADVISFGLAPSMIMFQLIVESPGNPAWLLGGFPVVPFFAFLMAAAGALRLAKFNTDPAQETVFRGMPIPANGLFVASLPLILGQFAEGSQIIKLLENIYVLLAFIIFLSLLMVSTLPMMSLKFKNLGWKDNSYRYILIILSVILFSLLHYLAVPFIILLYIILSVIYLSFKKEK